MSLYNYWFVSSGLGIIINSQDLGKEIKVLNLMAATLTRLQFRIIFQLGMVMSR